MLQYFPDATLIFLVGLFSIARLENQVWNSNISRGIRGANQSFAAFLRLIAAITGFFALVFANIFLVAVFWDSGWQTALLIFIFGLIVTIVYSLSSSSSNGIFWIISTIACWPLMFILSRYVTWFGYLDKAQ